MKTLTQIDLQPSASVKQPKRSENNEKENIEFVKKKKEKKREARFV